MIQCAPVSLRLGPVTMDVISHQSMCCRVLCRTSILGHQKEVWQSCLAPVAETIKQVAGEVKISAICQVDSKSGLLEYTITGNVIFTQLVTSYLFRKPHETFSSYRRGRRRSREQFPSKTSGGCDFLASVVIRSMILLSTTKRN